INVNDVPLKEVPTDHNDHPNIGHANHPQNIEQQPCLRCNTSVSYEDLKDEIDQLRLGRGKFTESVKVLNNYAIYSFEKIFKLLDFKEKKKNRDEVSVSKVHQSVDDDDTNDRDGYQYFGDHDFATDVPQEIMATNQAKSDVKANEGVANGVSDIVIS
ncbi:hypothetical protein HAX54_029843, partial [Datura stramonium]|nr:hypothetical protein [Datura stramonium]